MEPCKVRTEWAVLFVQMSFSFWHIEDDAYVDFHVISSRLRRCRCRNVRQKFAGTHIGKYRVIRNNKKYRTRLQEFIRRLYTRFYKYVLKKSMKYDMFDILP